MERTRSGREIIDIVIPAFNEESGIGRTLEQLAGCLAGSRYRFEVIVVDDGSSDATAEIAARFSLLPLRVVRLTRNFGKESALLAGLDHARGAATILMDADLQHPAALVPELLAHWERGYECVYAAKHSRSGEGWLRRVGSALFYAAINRGSEVAIPPDAGDFRLLDRAVVRALCSLRERVRFTKGLYAWLGFRQLGIPYVAAERAAGVTKYDAGRLLRLAWDGLTSFSDLPLRACGAVGAATASIALLYGAYIAARTLVMGADVPGWATLTDAIMFLGGLQILLLGVIGQYVRNVFLETKQRPNYLVREIVDANTAAGARPESSLERAAPNRAAAA
jgi:glycosyltransferase involved in cell wall biosynthesis